MLSAVRHICVYKSYGMRSNLKVGHSCLPQCSRNYSPSPLTQEDHFGVLVYRLNLRGAAEVEVLNRVPRTGGSEEDKL